MKIHSSAKFENKKISFHNVFELKKDAVTILENKEKVTNLAISNFKEKCEEYFKIEFSQMNFFEVYFFNEGQEIKLFKKEKL